jgi:hypothetical protein
MRAIARFASEIDFSESRSASRASRCVASLPASSAVSASMRFRSAASSSSFGAAAAAFAASSSARRKARVRP